MNSIQLTKKEAIDFYDSKKWDFMTFKEKVDFQLFQDRLCMPFAIFHEAMEKVFNRPIWTHEFAFRDKLIAEYQGKQTAPSMEDIINLIPEDKQIICLIK